MATKRVGWRRNSVINESCAENICGSAKSQLKANGISVWRRISIGVKENGESIRKQGWLWRNESS
jgi:hypothetical protein